VLCELLQHAASQHKYDPKHPREGLEVDESTCWPCMQGFDEVIQALPAAAGMSNLLLDVAACTSASLGVLVEAFPNKEAVLVDHLKALEALVNR